MSTPEPENRHDLVSVVGRVPLLRILLSSAGVLGVLAGIGYLAETAQENLLGIQLGERHSVNDYALAGGGFFADVLRVSWRHGVIAAVMIALIVAAALTAEAVRKRMHARRPQLTWLTGFVIIIVAYAVKSVWLDVPVIRMSDLLSTPPICAGTAAADRRDHDTWLHLVCARRDVNLDNALRSKNIQCPPEFSWSGWQHPERGLFTAMRYSRLSLEQKFTINVFVTGFLAYCALLLYTARSEMVVSPLARSVLHVVVLMISVVNVLALPFIYGKVIRSTDMPSGRIVYSSLSDDLKEEPRNVVALVLAANDKFALFYDTETNQFIEVARSKVHWIAIDGSEDLVVQRMIYFITTSNCAEGAPHASQ